MHSPQQTLSRAIDRASEITWWNRKMTKLDQVPGIDNSYNFAENELVEEKGPYVELVRAPAAQDTDAADFLNSLDYDSRITDALISTLFKGDEGGNLYQHQAETIAAIESTGQDTILSVPTATGKTEAFFLPILNHCIQTDEAGLKSIILYPMKTLTVDQLNRFLKYLDEVNKNQPREDWVTIGIWDGDTPHDVGSRDYEIEAGSYIRGLECPRTGEKLRVQSTNKVGTDHHSYSWVKVTRESIRQGVDILLTNPEAIDYMFVNNSSETRQILGSRPGEHPVRHIVIDEAHVWGGISGAGISLLVQRLKHFYEDSNPQVTMVSATVDNPAELAGSLTRSDENSINTVEFTGRRLPDPATTDFTRFRPCNLEEIVEAIGRVAMQYRDESSEEADLSQLDNAVQTLSNIGLLTTSDGEVRFATEHEDWFVSTVDSALTTLSIRDEFDGAHDVLESESGIENLTGELLGSSGHDTPWFEFVVDAVPEVLEFANWFDTDTTGSVGFKEYGELVRNLSATGVDDPQEVITTLLAFGRLAGIVTEKYHSFLKPPLKVHWCRECRILNRSNACHECGEEIPEMRFCRRCHHPYVALQEIEETEESEHVDDIIQDEEEDDEDEEDKFAPVGSDSPVDNCPGCGQYLNLTNIEVPTPTLLSFMLTEICRTSPSKKTLVFSDSHASAESVGSEIMSTEYGLMAESMYVKTLLENDGVVDNYEAFQTVSEQLREAYYDPLYQNEVDEDSETYNLLRQMRTEITSNAMLHNCQHLFDSALITPDPLYTAAGDDATKLIIGHELYSLFASGTPSFDRETVTIDGLIREKICDRIARQLEFSRATIESHIDELLSILLADRVIQERSWDDVQHEINESDTDADQRDDVFDYIESERDVLNRQGEYNEDFESGVFTRIAKEDQSNIRLIPRVTYCDECFSSFPVPEGESMDECVSCGAAVETFDRFEIGPDGTYSGQGYADIETDWSWPLDHWAYEVSRPLNDSEGPQHITVGIHKGNIPPTLRGAIEESFRKDSPGVNIVSATPTMELGVDIGTLETVTQVGMPPTLTNYVQRSGRTGRTRGSSSLVMTVVRGDHPVDNHYYANLNGFFREFEPVRVPDAFDYDEVLAGHVATVATAYLARNPHESRIFDKIYSLPEKYTNLETYVTKVSDRLEVLCEFIDDEVQDELRSYIDGIFGQPGVEVFEKVFLDEGPLSVRHRTDETFQQLVAMSGSTETNKRLSERHDRLDQWLSLLGYLANYRDIGQKFPVKFSGRQESIEFQSTGRLYDMFPGQENDTGSVFKFSGTTYLVSDVHGTTTPLTEVAVCTNEECDRPFQSYETETEICPHCEEELTSSNIHGVGSVDCRTAVGGEKGWHTRSIMSTHVTQPDDSFTEEEVMQLFDFDCTVERGEFMVTDFVYAFERGHTQSPDKTTYRSEALIERKKDTQSDDLSWEDRLDDVTQESYAPVGQRYHTQGIRLEFDRDDIQERLDRHAPGADWPQAMASLEQAMTKAVAILAGVDQQDFRVKTTLHEDTVSVLIVDGRQGGNGITWQVAQEVTEALPMKVREVAQCSKCANFCEECLLIARTPPSYLDNDLLNKHTLRGVICQAGG